MLLWRCCPWCSNGTLWEMLIWGYEIMFFISESPDAFVTLLHLMFRWDFVGNVDWRAMRPCSLFLSPLSLLWLCCTWCSNETLLEMLIWRHWVFVLNSWVSWCFCDTVAPDVQMRLCWKCWCEGSEYLFLIPEPLDAFVTLLHLMFKWDFVGNVDLKAMSICS